MPDFIEPDPPSVRPEAAGIDAELLVGTYDRGTYGNGFGTAEDTDGLLSFVFEASGTRLDLAVRGWDIDSATEVELRLNGQHAGYLEPTAEGEQSLTTLTLKAGLVHAGVNTLQFLQTGSPWRDWGVTDILLLEPGMTELPFSWDPEFTEDGWVAWQVDFDGFYLGRMDMDTGGFLGVDSHLPIPPITWFETVQAVELIRTEDGVVALGMSHRGIVWLDEDGGGVIGGTQGMRFTATPKGDVPGIRFIAYDEAGRQFLHDDGELTELDLGLFQAWQWLNGSEVLVRNKLTGITLTYDVETGARTLVTDLRYNDGQAAAFTASDGVQYVTLQGNGFRDIYRNDGAGWGFQQRMVTPFAAGSQHFSSEFFEWQGRIFMTGFLADELGWTAPSVIALYDLENDLWVQLSGVEAWKDPEALVLNDGRLAYYADRTSTSTQHFNVVSYERAMLHGLAGSVDATGVPGLAAAGFAVPPFAGANPLAVAPDVLSDLPSGPTSTALPAAATAAVTGAASTAAMAAPMAETMPDPLVALQGTDDFAFRPRPAPAPVSGPVSAPAPGVARPASGAVPSADPFAALAGPDGRF